MVGNLNEILYHSEKKGGLPKSQCAIDEFRDVFIDKGLFNHGFVGYQFTSCNYKGGAVVEECLDCFCTDTD